MRIFQLLRHEDATGVSGAGVVAEGVEFSDGSVALSWLTEHTSMGIYRSVDDVEKIHGHSGKTEIIFEN